MNRNERRAHVGRGLYSRGSSIRWLLNQTPADGCLFVFNAYRISWAARISHYMPGILRVHVIGGLSRAANQDQRKPCDLYITWRE